MTNNNPFDEAKAGKIIPQETGLISVEQERAIAEVQAALVIAKKFPRDQIKAMDKIINSCTRISLAETALYEYARGGTDITGPSIRLAEVIAQNWGNMVCGVVELSRRHGESDCLAYAWCLESNFRDEKRFTVKHQRDTKSGSRKVEAERDIYEVLANLGARRKRACILAVIPGDVTESAVNQIHLTLKAKAEVTPERIQNLINKFGEYGITKAQIEKRIQRHIDSMSPAQMINLGKIYNSLKDGMSVASEWFETEREMEEPKSGAEALKDKLKGQTGNDEQAEESFPCEVPGCDFVAVSERGLKKHMTQSHPEPVEEPPDEHGENGGLSEDEEFFKAATGYADELGLPAFNTLLMTQPFNVKDVEQLPESQRKDFLKACSRKLDGNIEEAMDRR